MTKEKAELKIPAGCHGHDLQELMYKFVNWYSLANERRDKISYEVSQQKLIVELTEAQAIISVDDDAKTANEKLTTDIRKSRMLTRKVKIGEEEISPYDQRERLILLQSELNNIEAKVKDLDRLIIVCQSGLSFDRQEMGMSGGS